MSRFRFPALVPLLSLGALAMLVMLRRRRRHPAEVYVHRTPVAPPKPVAREPEPEPSAWEPAPPAPAEQSEEPQWWLRRSA